jgi:hypothetical protein
MSKKITGLEGLLKKIDMMKRQVNKYGGSRTVPTKELLNPEFLRKYTRLSSFQDFEKIPESMIDEFIRQNSRFHTWNEMLENAAAEYYSKKLEL